MTQNNLKKNNSGLPDDEPEVYQLAEAGIDKGSSISDEQQNLLKSLLDVYGDKVLEDYKKELKDELYLKREKEDVRTQLELLRYERSRLEIAELKHKLEKIQRSSHCSSAADQYPPLSQSASYSENRLEKNREDRLRKLEDELDELSSKKPAEKIQSDSKDAGIEKIADYGFRFLAEQQKHFFEMFKLFTGYDQKRNFNADAGYDEERICEKIIAKLTPIIDGLKKESGRRIDSQIQSEAPNSSFSEDFGSGDSVIADLKSKLQEKDSALKAYEDELKVLKNVLLREESDKENINRRVSSALSEKRELKLQNRQLRNEMELYSQQVHKRDKMIEDYLDVLKKTEQDKHRLEEENFYLRQDVQSLRGQCRAKEDFAESVKAKSLNAFDVLSEVEKLFCLNGATSGESAKKEELIGNIKSLLSEADRNKELLNKKDELISDMIKKMNLLRNDNRELRKMEQASESMDDSGPQTSDINKDN